MIGSLLAIVALQSAVPDYAQQAQDLARLATAVEACHHAGYKPRALAIQEEREAFDRRLRADGMTPERIAQLAGDAARVEANQLVRSTDLPRGVPNEETRAFAREARGFLYRRCEEAKAAFPSAFSPADTEQRVLFGYLGLWVDHKLVEETEFYLTARGACATYMPPVDAHDLSDKLSRPFASDPAAPDLQNHYRSVFREGLEMGADYDETQCARLMRTADRALETAWRDHWNGAPPSGPLD